MPDESIRISSSANFSESGLQKTIIFQTESAIMKKVLVLFLVAFISACDQAPLPPVQEAPRLKATPVQNAPKTTPIPIQPLTSLPSMPQTAPIPTPISTPAESGTARAIPAGSSAPMQNNPPASPEPDNPPPSATGS